MRQQQTFFGLDQAAASAVASPASVEAATPTGPDAPSELADLPQRLPSAIAELLSLIGESLDDGVPLAALMAEAAVPAAGLLPVPAAPEAQSITLPDLEIQPLAPTASAAAVEHTPLSAASLPGGAPEPGAALFDAFRLDLADAEPPALPSLESKIDPLPGPTAPPTVEIGRVTMFEGQSEFEVTAATAGDLSDPDGRLTIEGDGDDLVVLRDGWSFAGTGAGGFALYQEPLSGAMVAVRGADVVLI